MHVTTPAHLGDIIRARRNELGLDQAALAEQCGVSRQWLVSVEKGKPRAQIGLVMRVLREVGVELSVSWQTATPSVDAVTDPSPSTIDDIVGEILTSKARRRRDPSDG